MNEVAILGAGELGGALAHVLARRDAVRVIRIVDDAGRIAQLTHAEDDNVDAVVLWTLMLRHAVLTGELDAAIGLPWLEVGHRHRWESLIGEALAGGRHPRDFSHGNGWVVRAFQAALCAVAGAGDVSTALNRAIRGGNDTDTVAAIAGSLAGALWGLQAVPAAWRRRVHGWPGYTADDLTGLTLRAARRILRPPVGGYAPGGIERA